MAKFIGVKMIEAVPMTAREANDKGHKIGNHSFEEDGYEVTYPDGYKSWSPAKEFEKAYYKLEDPAGDVLKENDIKRFIKDIENVKVGTKTTNTTLTCLTGFEVHGQSSCIKPENFNLGIGAGVGFSYKRQLEIALKYDIGLSNAYPNLVEAWTMDPNTQKKKSEQVLSLGLTYFFK